MRKKKFAQSILYILSTLAVVFANIPCRGKIYEPIVPKELVYDGE